MSRSIASNVVWVGVRSTMFTTTRSPVAEAFRMKMAGLSDTGLMLMSALTGVMTFSLLFFPLHAATSSATAARRRAACGGCLAGRRERPHGAPFRPRPVQRSDTGTRSPMDDSRKYTGRTRRGQRGGGLGPKGRCTGTAPDRAAGGAGAAGPWLRRNALL